MSDLGYRGGRYIKDKKPTVGDKLLPYPIPFERKIYLMLHGVNAMIARYDHGEDSKELHEAKKVLDRFELNMRKCIGIDKEVI